MNTNYRPKNKIRTEIRETGIVGVSLNLDLVRVQNLAHLRDRLIKWQANKVDTNISREKFISLLEEVAPLTVEAVKILNFICGDIQSPLADDLWDNVYEPRANNEL